MAKSKKAKEELQKHWFTIVNMKNKLLSQMKMSSRDKLKVEILSEIIEDHPYSKTVKNKTVKELEKAHLELSYKLYKEAESKML